MKTFPITIDKMNKEKIRELLFKLLSVNAVMDDKVIDEWLEQNQPKPEPLLNALNALLIAVKFKSETVDFNGVRCYEARVPIEFVEMAEASIKKIRGEK